LYLKHSQSFLLVRKHRTWSSCNETVKWIPTTWQGRNRNGKEIGKKIFEVEGKMHRGQRRREAKKSSKNARKCFLLSNEVGAEEGNKRMK